MKLSQINTLNTNPRRYNKKQQAMQSKQPEISFEGGLKMSTFLAGVAVLGLTGGLIGIHNYNNSEKKTLKENIELYTDTPSDSIITNHTNVIKNANRNYDDYQDTRKLSENFTNNIKNKLTANTLSIDEVKKEFKNFNDKYAESCTDYIDELHNKNFEQIASDDSIKKFNANLVKICIDSIGENNKELIDKTSEELAWLSKRYNLIKEHSTFSDEKNYDKGDMKKIEKEINEKLQAISELYTVGGFDLLHKDGEIKIKKEMKTLYKELNIYKDNEQINKDYETFVKANQDCDEKNAFASVMGIVFALAFGISSAVYKFYIEKQCPELEAKHYFMGIRNIVKQS